MDKLEIMCMDIGHRYNCPMLLNKETYDQEVAVAMLKGTYIRTPDAEFILAYISEEMVDITTAIRTIHSIPGGIAPMMIDTYMVLAQAGLHEQDSATNFWSKHEVIQFEHVTRNYNTFRLIVLQQIKLVTGHD